ncbi:hypothetical protein [Catalinimonas niigatensis]|uniref:hypothetical protein n=1 Tax=Catalinimonas niigatensis TaxID=1397264 RepID=UPI002666EAEC|nr:hypothetical protein [Catalinimonas niigatensis]WPP47974.1 hypothetical protein PZB72_14950 [Catalinimonas niigatensis]
MKDKLLDALDKSANSNSFWLSFEIANEESFDVTKFLIHTLRTTVFHYELMKQDLERSWNNYSEIVMPKDWNTPIFVQKPGNTWNGNTDLKFELVSEDKVRELLIDLLTGQQKHYSRTSFCSPIKLEKANLIIDEFLREIKKKDENWKAYNFEPNFLNRVKDTLEVDATILSYFEESGRDLALGIKEGETFHMILTNGYP